MNDPVNESGFWYWVVDKLPDKLVYFCFLRVWYYATHGKYENTQADRISCNAAIERFRKDFKLFGE